MRPQVTRRNLPIKPVRQNLYLLNHELLASMAGAMNLSWFVDELIEREHRRREKRANGATGEKKV